MSLSNPNVQKQNDRYDIYKLVTIVQLTSNTTLNLCNIQWSRLTSTGIKLLAIFSIIALPACTGEPTDSLSPSPTLSNSQHETSSEEAVPLCCSDLDGDGYYGSVSKTCQVDGSVVSPLCGSDCDDTEPLTHPDIETDCATQSYEDNDCDGNIDEDTMLLYLDEDGDGDGVYATGKVTCSDMQGDWVESSGDCDDSDPEVYFGAPTICGDELDQDCDNNTDEGLIYLNLDSDLDGYGGTAGVTQACAPSEGWSDIRGDCDDDNYEINPSATEVCGNSVDEDCDDWSAPCADYDLVFSTELEHQIIDSQGSVQGHHICIIDYNHDGYDDLIRADPFVSLPSGKLGLVQGYLGPLSEELITSEPDLIITGVKEEMLGYSLSCNGDNNNDGFPDLVIGSPRYYLVEGGNIRTTDDTVGRGSAYLFHTPLPESAITTDLSDAQLVDGLRDTNFGMNISSGSDLDGDGHDDVLVSDPLYDKPGQAENGAVYLFSGPLLGEISAESATSVLTGSHLSRFGSSMDALGDYNGDGQVDLAVGAPRSSQFSIGGGVANVFFGPLVTDKLHIESDLTLYSLTPYAFMGWALAPASSQFDEKDELLVGLPHSNLFGALSTGKACLFSFSQAQTLLEQGSAEWCIDGETEGDHIGTKLGVLTMQDLTEDRLFYMSAPEAFGDDGRMGAVYVFEDSRYDLTESLIKIQGQTKGGEFGHDFALSVSLSAHSTPSFIVAGVDVNLGNDKDSIPSLFIGGF